MQKYKVGDIELELAGDPVLIDDATTGIRHYHGPLDVVFDVGAYCGACGIYALERGAKFVVFVEPFTPNQLLLAKNLAHYEKHKGKYTVLTNAIWDKNGEYLSMGTITPGQTSLVYDMKKYTNIKESTHVLTISFSTLMTVYSNSVDYLKIDVEGAEFRFLSRTETTKNLLSIVRALDLDFHPPHNSGYFGNAAEWIDPTFTPNIAPEQLRSFLADCGFIRSSCCFGKHDFYSRIYGDFKD